MQRLKSCTEIEATNHHRQLGPDGRLTISVPRAYLVILSPGFETGNVHLENGPDDQTIELSKRS
jgi:hypothetical protein